MKNLFTCHVTMQGAQCCECSKITRLEKLQTIGQSGDECADGNAERSPLSGLEIGDEVSVSGSLGGQALQGFEELATRHAGSNNLLRNIAAAGFQCPTDIQRHAIPCMLARHDIYAIAPTGSGKTLAFLVPSARPHICPPCIPQQAVQPQKCLAQKLNDPYTCLHLVCSEHCTCLTTRALITHVLLSLGLLQYPSLVASLKKMCKFEGLVACSDNIWHGYRCSKCSLSMYHHVCIIDIGISSSPVGCNL
jgi:hypothetical protein